MWLRDLYRRVRALLRSEAIHSEIDEEMRFHLDMRAEEYVRKGMSPEEARREAERRFGRLTRLKEQGYEIRGGRWLETLWQDCRYGVRMLRKDAGFTAAAVLVLALGIGANTAIFSVVDAVLLRPLPYGDPHRLVWVWETHPNVKEEPASLPNFTDWKSQGQSFEGMAGFTNSSLALTGEGEPERIPATFVVGDFFGVLGVSPALGRVFTAEEDMPGAGRVVILGHSVWQRRFGGDPNIIGKSLTLSGNPHTVVGVMPKGFKDPLPAQRRPAELWAPLGLAVNPGARRSDFLSVVARMKPGVTLSQAQAEMNTVAARLSQQYPESNTSWGVTLLALHERVTGDVGRPLWLLMGVVGLLLLLACANVANLLLARSAARSHEIAIRRALGAGRWRLVRQFITESVLLSLIGGALGAILASSGVAALVALSPGNIPRLEEVGVSWPVLAFTLAASLVTGLLFGLLPALHATSPHLTESLKEGGRGTTQGGRGARVRSALVVSEVAIALVLLVGAGLLIRSFVRLQGVDPGFHPERVLAADVVLPGAKYREDAQVINFYDRLLSGMRGRPGVEAVAAVSVLPLTESGAIITFLIEGRAAPAPGESQDAEYRIATPDYFRALGIPVIRGSVFSERDTANMPYVMVVNETFARRNFPGEDAVGKRVNLGDPAQAPWRTIVGVVKDVRHQSLDAEPYPQMYTPLGQSPRRSMSVVVRAGGDPKNAIPLVRSELAALDRDLPLYNVRTMQEVLSESVARQRFSMLLVAIFAFLGLALASVGIYGVIAYSVTQRTHEIGVRMALGAEAMHILKMVVRQGMILAVVGVCIGLVAARGLAQLMSGLLFGVSPTDVITFTGVSILLTAVAMLACVIPALRATRVNPMVALKYE
jgi:predicted permease